MSSHTKNNVPSFFFETKTTKGAPNAVGPLVVLVKESTPDLLKGDGLIGGPSVSAGDFKAVNEHRVDRATALHATTRHRCWM